MKQFILCFIGVFCFLKPNISLAQDIGIASFYNDYFNGKMTASGTVFDNSKMTCAHKSLPFGTQLKVTNTTNDRSVIVTVTDRGPYIKGRVLDLTYAAAKALGFVNSGTATVFYEFYVETVEPVFDTIRKPSSDTLRVQTASTFITIEPSDSLFYEFYGVKLATFEAMSDAMKAANTVVNKYKIPAHVEEVQLTDTKFFRLFLGSFTAKQEAEKLVAKTKKNYPEGYVVQYKKLR